MPAVAMSTAAAATAVVTPTPSAPAPSTTAAAAATTRTTVAIPISLRAASCNALRSIVPVEVGLIRLLPEVAAAFDFHRRDWCGFRRSFTTTHLRALFFQDGLA